MGLPTTSKILTVLCSLNASRFSPRPNVQLCRDAEEDDWNVLVKFAFLQHALAARKDEKHRYHGISPTLLKIVGL